VPDEIWDEAARHYDEEGLAALLLSIATTNVFGVGDPYGVASGPVEGGKYWNLLEFLGWCYCPACE
jgi:hypothetical protein